MRKNWSLNDALDAAETATVSAQASAEQQLEDGATRLIEVTGEREQLQTRLNVRILFIVIPQPFCVCNLCVVPFVRPSTYVGPRHESSTGLAKSIGCAHDFLSVCTYALLVVGLLVLISNIFNHSKKTLWYM